MPQARYSLRNITNSAVQLKNEAQQRRGERNQAETSLLRQNEKGGVDTLTQAQPNLNRL
jgi:hypothetical protein